MALTHGSADAPEDSGRARRAGGRDPPRRARSRFEQQVRDALAHLHDPGHLQTHPLVAALRLDQGPGEAGTATTASAWSAGAALQQRLLAAIETLRPRSGAAAGPAATKAERGHRLLSLRYVEALPVAAVQRALAVGESEYFREHRRGLQAVVSLLQERGGGDEAAAGAADGSAGAPAGPSAGARRTNLPAQRTSFVGRERELRGIGRALVGEPETASGESGGPGTVPTRLLTLTGPGGCGKTRLALQ